jgi:hypothetical protein
VKFQKRKRAAKKFSKPLDKVSAKRLPRLLKAEQGKNQGAQGQARYSTGKPRGRPPTIPRSWVTGRAYNYKIQLGQVWPRLQGSLLEAQTEEEVERAFENNGQPYAQNFVPAMASDILALIHDSKFPKRAEARVNFLADSLGGRPNLSFRSSRDLCEQERVREKRTNRIVRYEFYIECSCGYKGRSLDHACPKCRAQIDFGFGSILGSSLYFNR